MRLTRRQSLGRVLVPLIEGLGVEAQLTPHPARALDKIQHPPVKGIVLVGAENPSFSPQTFAQPPIFSHNFISLNNISIMLRYL